MDGTHDLFYRRVLNSKGILPATETVPDLDDFPIDGGFQEHVSNALEIYKDLRQDSCLITT